MQVYHPSLDNIKMSRGVSIDKKLPVFYRSIKNTPKPDTLLMEQKPQTVAPNGHL